MADDSVVSIADQLACIDRELNMREKLYPRWVNETPPKMTPRTMELELGRMRAVRASLERLGRLDAFWAALREATVLRDWNVPAATLTLHARSPEALQQVMELMNHAGGSLASIPTSPSPGVAS